MSINLIGSDWDTINVSITAAATDTAIPYPKAIKSFSLWSRNSYAFTYKRASADSKSITFAQGERVEIKAIVSDANVAGSVLGYITITNGSADVIEGLVTF